MKDKSVGTVQLIKVKREKKIICKLIGSRKGYKKTEAPQGLKIQKGSEIRRLVALTNTFGNAPVVKSAQTVSRPAVLRKQYCRVCG